MVHQIPLLKCMIYIFGLFFLNACQREFQAHGMVIDMETKEPVHNATIYNKQDIKQRVLTDDQGKFSLPISQLELPNSSTELILEHDQYNTHISKIQPGEHTIIRMIRKVKSEDLRSEASDPNNKLSGMRRTIVVRFHSFGCQCIYFIETMHFVVIQSEKEEEIGEVIYIEPASENLKIQPDKYSVAYNLILEGQFYQNKDYPKGIPNKSLDIEKKAVFKYKKVSYEKP